MVKSCNQPRVELFTFHLMNVYICFNLFDISLSSINLVVDLKKQKNPQSISLLNTSYHCSINHQTLFKSDSTKVGTSSEAVVALWSTRSCKSLCCLGPNCWMMSGSKSLMVLVSGSPDTMKVLFWIEAQASGLTKCNTVLSSLKKLISSTPNCWAPVFLTRFLTTLSLLP